MPARAHITTLASAEQLLAALSPEWDRMALLVQVSAAHKAGKVAEPEVMQTLKEACQAVAQNRAAGVWSPVEAVSGIPACSAVLAYDGLAACLLPLVRPSSAFNLIALQHPGHTEPTLTLAALHDILALSSDEDPAFLDTLQQLSLIHI